jgi:hypothetical protein
VRRKVNVQGEGGNGGGTSMTQFMRDGNRKGEAMGVAIFRGEEGEEARRLHRARGGQHSEEWRDGLGGRRRVSV